MQYLGEKKKEARLASVSTREKKGKGGKKKNGGFFSKRTEEEGKNSYAFPDDGKKEKTDYVLKIYILGKKEKGNIIGLWARRYNWKKKKGGLQNPITSRKKKKRCLTNFSTGKEKETKVLPNWMMGRKRKKRHPPFREEKKKKEKKKSNLSSDDVLGGKGKKLVKVPSSP